MNIQAITDVSNFYKYTLTEQEYNQAAGFYLAVLLVVCILGKAKYKDERKLAWVVSAFTSGLMTILGAVYLYVKQADLPKVLYFQPNGWSVFHGINNVGALACLYFGIAMAVDLSFGLLFYRRQLGILTAYIHHTVFIWMMIVAVTGNGGFLKMHQFTPAFCSMLIEEIPTFLLAAGSIDSRFRTDIGFGLTFFLFRICYHGYFFAYCFYSKCDTAILVLYSLTMTMHVNWFYTWVTKYGMKLLGAGKKKSKKDA